MKTAHFMLMVFFINAGIMAMEINHAYYENLIKERLSRGLTGEDLGAPVEYDNVGLGNRLIFKNFLDLLVVLLKNNLDPKPLMYTAAFQLNFGAIQLLVEHKATVSTCACSLTKEKICALHVVCTFCRAAYGHQIDTILHIIDFLLDRGAPINAQDYFGLTPLMCVAQDKHKMLPRMQFAIVQRLLDRGADVTLISKDNLGSGSAFNCKTACQMALINERPELAALIETYSPKK